MVAPWASPADERTQPIQDDGARHEPAGEAAARTSAGLDTGPAHGKLDLHAGGSFTHAPADEFSGVDAFTYRANDGAADSNIATVRITVGGYRIFLPVVLRNF